MLWKGEIEEEWKRQVLKEKGNRIRNLSLIEMRN
jgi:hypothetical protein